MLQVGSTIIAQAAGVPTLPWSGSGVAIDYATCNGVVPVRGSLRMENLRVLWRGRLRANCEDGWDWG